MKKIIYIAGALMLLFPALSGAQALSYTAADTDAASLGTAGANLAQTHSIAGAAFSNVAAVPFSDAKFDAAAGFTMWQPSSVKSNMINVGAAYNMKNKLGVAFQSMQVLLIVLSRIFRSESISVMPPVPLPKVTLTEPSQLTYSQ